MLLLQLLVIELEAGHSRRQSLYLLYVELFHLVYPIHDS